jgi:hypothetical protein
MLPTACARLGGVTAALFAARPEGRLADSYRRSPPLCWVTESLRGVSEWRRSPHAPACSSTLECMTSLRGVARLRTNDSHGIFYTRRHIARYFSRPLHVDRASHTYVPLSGRTRLRRICPGSTRLVEAGCGAHVSTYQEGGVMPPTDCHMRASAPARVLDGHDERKLTSEPPHDGSQVRIESDC